MAFLVAYNSFWKNYFNFKGRATRQEYWFTQVWHIIIYVIFIIGIFTTGRDTFRSIFSSDEIEASFQSGGQLFFAILVIGYTLLIIIPHISLKVRRFHDVGLSSKWFIILITITIAISLSIDFFELPSSLELSCDVLKFVEFIILALPTDKFTKK